MISSVGGQNGSPFVGPYSASKFALEGACEELKRLCFERGAEDNLTAVIADFGEREYMAAEEQTRPRIPASVVQAQIAEAAPAKQRFEVSLKPSEEAPPAPAGPSPDPAAGAANKGPLRKAMGTKEITLKVPTVRMPKKEEMSKAMKISLLATALLAGIIIGILLGGPVARLFNALTGDPYKERNIRQAPTDPDIAAAYALHLEGRTSDAREALKKYLSTNPTSAEAHFYMGRISADDRKFDDAINHLTEATRLDPALSDAWSNLAFVYLAIGQKSNAMDCLQRAIKLDSGSARPESAPAPAPSAPAATPKAVG